MIDAAGNTDHSESDLPPGNPSSSPREADHRKLDLSHQRLTSIEWRKWHKDVQELNMESNYLSAVDGQRFPICERVLGSKNRFTSFKWFLHMRQLRYLDMSNNQFTTLKLVNDLVNLTDLIITNNEISGAEKLCLPKLLTLDLSYNKLTDLPDVSGCPLLTDLMLRHNNIDTLQNISVKLGSTLKCLDLACNPLTDLSQLVFLNKSGISWLGLESCPCIGVADIEYRILVISLLSDIATIDDCPVSKMERLEGEDLSMSGCVTGKRSNFTPGRSGAHVKLIHNLRQHFARPKNDKLDMIMTKVTHPLPRVVTPSRLRIPQESRLSSGSIGGRLSQENPSSTSRQGTNAVSTSPMSLNSSLRKESRSARQTDASRTTITSLSRPESEISTHSPCKEWENKLNTSLAKVGKENVEPETDTSLSLDSSRHSQLAKSTSSSSPTVAAPSRLSSAILQFSPASTIARTSSNHPNQSPLSRNMRTVESPQLDAMRRTSKRINFNDGEPDVSLNRETLDSKQRTESSTSECSSVTLTGPTLSEASNSSTPVLGDIVEEMTEDDNEDETQDGDTSIDESESENQLEDESDGISDEHDDEDEMHTPAETVDELNSASTAVSQRNSPIQDKTPTPSVSTYVRAEQGCGPRPMSRARLVESSPRLVDNACSTQLDGLVTKLKNVEHENGHMRMALEKLYDQYDQQSVLIQTLTSNMEDMHNRHNRDMHELKKMIVDMQTSSLPRAPYFRAVDQNTVELGWNDGPIEKYNIIVNGECAGSTSKKTARITDLVPDVHYTVQVQAIDGGGRATALSAPVVFTL